MKTYVSFDTALELAVAILEPAARPGDGYLCSLDDDARAEAFDKIDEAGLRVDRLLRDAVATRHLLVWVESNGALIEAVDPDLTKQGENVLLERGNLEVLLAGLKGAEIPRRGRNPLPPVQKKILEIASKRWPDGERPPRVLDRDRQILEDWPAEESPPDPRTIRRAFKHWTIPDK